jgi:uncharacterized membrane protein
MKNIYAIFVYKYILNVMQASFGFSLPTIVTYLLIIVLVLKSISKLEPISLNDRKVKIKLTIALITFFIATTVTEYLLSPNL